MADLLLFTADRAGVLTFAMPVDPQIVSGIPQLTQEVVIELLSDFRPDLGRGTGMLRNLAAITSDDQAGAERVVQDALAVVRRNIIERQQGNSALTAEERMEDLQLLSVKNQGTLEWKIDLELVPQRGDSLIFTVPGISDDPV